MKSSLTTANTETNTRKICKHAFYSLANLGIYTGIHTWNHDTLGLRGEYIMCFISFSYSQLCLLQCLSLSELLAGLDVQEKR